MQEGNAGSNCAVIVSLEEDIEGATLDEPLETKTIPQLRWWLLCHGSEPPASEKKPSLIKRYGARVIIHLRMYSVLHILLPVIAGLGRRKQTNPQLLMLMALT